MFEHQSVLYEEVLDGLALKKGGVYVDGTVGGGGHAEGILEGIGWRGHLIAIDQDEIALAAAKERLIDYTGRVFFVHDNYVNMPDIIDRFAPEGVDGILLDIGVSSPQLDNPERGFSYMHDAPLDMRMDRSQGRDARALVNEESEEALARLIADFGEDKWAKRIAALIVERRAVAPIETTFQLVDAIERAIPKGARVPGSHVAKRTFQALRIAVNDELGVLERVLEEAVDRLRPGGRIAVISFHSLEDRIVKNKFKYLASSCVCPPEMPICTCDKEPTVRIITRRPITATSAELAANPRAASAKLRVAEKME